ncbi:cell division protein ZipA-like [Nothobranchius furzeri]|uniref:cell division protein ZipA-like n=1 Tax=Nothobranchius furzeri TaxID=105023 RepID=UPI0039046746
MEGAPSPRDPGAAPEHRNPRETATRKAPAPLERRRGSPRGATTSSRQSPGRHRRQAHRPTRSLPTPSRPSPGPSDPGPRGDQPRRGPSRAQGPRPHQTATGIGQADAKNLKPPDPGEMTQADQGTALHTRCGRERGDEDLYHQKKSQEKGGVKGPT